ncbi:MAG: hypothetical protein PHV02_15085 [Rhodocyclaceae bacterium]|nr:hypothetical protein [Rhodocyclaceae bacterium]
MISMTSKGQMATPNDTPSAWITAGERDFFDVSPMTRRYRSNFPTVELIAPGN